MSTKDPADLSNARMNFGLAYLRSCGALTSLRSIGGQIMAGLVLREDREGLATLTLNRPEKLNSLNVEMFIELRAHVDEIARETDRIGLVVVRGAGKCFSAGHDLADNANGARPPKPNFQS